MLKDIFSKYGIVGIWLICFCISLGATSQPKPQDLTIELSLNNNDWIYNIGEQVSVSGVVKYKGKSLDSVKVKYDIGPEMLTAIIADSIIITNGSFVLQAGTMQNPGFLRCTVKVEYKGKEYREVITAAFDPNKIAPTVDMPSDFMDFWQKAIKDNREIPLDPKMTLLKDRSTEELNVYEISFQNYKLGSRIYGILCVPKSPGRYPAIFNPPGAGIHKIQGDLTTAKNGFITLQIGIHGIPLNMEPEEYKKLANTTFKRYRVEGMENKDTYYFKRVYLGCVRAIDFIYTLPEFDGENIAVTGGSQGGALTLVTAALDKRIKYLAAYAPALSDLTGYLHNRAGGWPHMFKTSINNNEKLINSLQYYDAVNFAKHIRVPGLYSFGYNDETTPPTSMFSAYNSIMAPKELYVVKETGHWYNRLQTEKRADWLQNKLRKN